MLLQKLFEKYRTQHKKSHQRKKIKIKYAKLIEIINRIEMIAMKILFLFFCISKQLIVNKLQIKIIEPNNYAKKLKCSEHTRCFDTSQTFFVSQLTKKNAIFFYL